MSFPWTRAFLVCVAAFLLCVFPFLACTLAIAVLLYHWNRLYALSVIFIDSVNIIVKICGNVNLFHSIACNTYFYE